MDQYENGSNQSGEFKADNEQILPEEDSHHPTEEAKPDSHHVKPETHIPSLLDLDEKFPEQNGDIPDKNLKKEEASPKVREEDFDFEKKLPDIPHDSLKNEDSSMKFSPAHFQDEVSHDEVEHPPVETKKEEHSEGDVEEDEDEVEEEEEVLEPEQEVSHWKPQEASPEAVVPKSEEIFTPPSQSHRSPSPVPVEEPKHETLSNKLPESLPAGEEKSSISNVTPISQAETPKSLQAEPASLVELATLAEPTTIAAEPLKTRSVKSTKSDGTGGHSFLVLDLVHWRDPRKSGIVLGAILAILLSLSVVSVVSVISYSALAVLSGTLSFRLYKNVLQAVQKTQDGHPFKEYLEHDVTVTTEKVHEVADLTAAKLNASLVELRRLFLVEDLVDSVKFALVLWLLTYVGSLFNGLTLVILAVVGLFTLPKVYETHQEKIDQNLDLVKGKINDVVDKVQAVLPIGKKAKSQ
ncbi:reticulon-3-like isoform X2 [Daphnia pulicaria]|uniref:reticulon-3-like isoform X2 n=1 Tax=Daphnia pulicaria TaxID=35523 RepID=UPI001EEBEFA5|nr:reticulon-3-like isoform X2 [Daphnia pulicaria]